MFLIMSKILLQCRTFGSHFFNLIDVCFPLWLRDSSTAVRRCGTKWSNEAIAEVRKARPAAAWQTVSPTYTFSRIKGSIQTGLKSKLSSCATSFCDSKNACEINFAYFWQNASIDS